MRIMLLFLTLVTLLLQFEINDAVSRDITRRPEVIKAILGQPVSLDCTYNCSSGFVRGEWKWEDMTRCRTCQWVINHKNKSEDMCTVNLYTANLTLEQTHYNYSCVSVMSDHQDLPHKTERLISLQVQDMTTSSVIPSEDVSLKLEIQNGVQEDYIVKGLSRHSIKVAAGTQLQVKCISTDTHCEIQWMSNNENFTKARSGTLLQWGEIQEEDGGIYTCITNQLCSSRGITVEIEVITEGDRRKQNLEALLEMKPPVLTAIKKYEFVWIKALAAVTLFAATVLTIVLMYLCCKSRCTVSETEESDTAIYANMRTSKEGMTQKPTPQDCQSDHEVPYADIVISVRGSSIPELVGLHSQAPRNHRLKWGEEAAGGSHLQACRSADRLHVHPKEVSRKLSTTSEYAIITYSTEALT